MKQLVLGMLATAGLLWATSASAQTASTIPNGNLDTWVTRNGLEVPENWSTIDEALKAFGPLYTSVTASKSTDVHAGSFAARMETKNDLILSALLGGPLPGGIVLGNLSADDIENVQDEDLSAVGGKPFITRASNMQFFYKLTGDNALADSAYAFVVLTRTVGNTKQTIASGSLRLLPAATYTLSSVPLQYTSSLAPDSVHIGFLSGAGEVRTVGTTLLVDDVTMTGTVAGTRNKANEAALQIYPNPSSSGEFSLASLSQPGLSTAPFTVVDATGRVVLRQAAAPGSTSRGRLVDLRGQQAGVYVLRLDTPEGPLTRKLVVQ
ncbi:T9SS type A sorting domain-containing protein [Hymenobacter mucosus]|uniref:Por secretion system C-terminal sorting domain-containing protein n=1 Tax=Hymenobacter mucosus TaxID=1411120 RepID=A0A238VYF2_9BACT|nr:T9SS type A sorting domain-containing protein [Hymenobacter mucosus]SNR39326.1 Por secretion system C-terminal sorting domain-containing protein [Hymenobacter mucosus]